MLILTREQSRQVDAIAIERYGMTGLVLMENAGRGAAEIIRRIYNEEPGRTGEVVICCGKGNNGGDGFVVARHLDAYRVPVRVLLFADPAKLTGDAAANYEIIRRADIPIEVYCDDFDEARLARSLTDTAMIVDALLGTGSKGDPRPPLDQVIAALNEHSARTIALDIPSGLDCDTGEPAMNTFLADDTITFVALKLGFEVCTAQACLGRVHVVDIGVPRKLLEELAAEIKQEHLKRRLRYGAPPLENDKTITLCYRSMDPQHDNEFYRSSDPIEEKERESIGPLSRDSAEQFWLDVIARRWRQSPGALPPSHWVNRCKTNGPSWYDQVNNPVRPDPIVEFLRSESSWTDGCIVFVVINGDWIYRTTWGGFLKYWSTFLAIKGDAIILRLNDRAFVRLMDSGVVYSGRRDPHSALDREADLSA